MSYRDTQNLATAKKNVVALFLPGMQIDYFFCIHVVRGRGVKILEHSPLASPWARTMFYPSEKIGGDARARGGQIYFTEYLHPLLLTLCNRSRPDHARLPHGSLIFLVAVHHPQSESCTVNLFDIACMKVHDPCKPWRIPLCVGTYRHPLLPCP